MKFPRLIICFLILSTQLNAQLSSVIADFKPAYSYNEVEKYLNTCKSYNIRVDKKDAKDAELVVKLFKVLTSKTPSINWIEFKHAMNLVGLSYSRVLLLNDTVEVVKVQHGAYSSYLLINNSVQHYSFKLVGKSTSKNSVVVKEFDNYILGEECKALTYDTLIYSFKLLQLKEID